MSKENIVVNDNPKRTALLVNNSSEYTCSCGGTATYMSVVGNYIYYHYIKEIDAEDCTPAVVGYAREWLSAANKPGIKTGDIYCHRCSRTITKVSIGRKGYITDVSEELWAQKKK